MPTKDRILKQLKDRIYYRKNRENKLSAIAYRAALTGSSKKKRKKEKTKKKESERRKKISEKRRLDDEFHQKELDRAKTYREQNRKRLMYKMQHYRKAAKMAKNGMDLQKAKMIMGLFKMPFYHFGAANYKHSWRQQK